MIGRMCNFFFSKEQGKSETQQSSMMGMFSTMMKSFFSGEDKQSGTSANVNPEVEILKIIEDEVVAYVNETKSIDSVDIALKLKIPVDSAKYLIKKLILEGRIDV